jgi:transposase
MPESLGGELAQEIARRLGLDPRTVRRWIGRIAAGSSEPRLARRPSKLDSLFEVIQEKVLRGLSATQIWQDLRREVEGFSASYESVKRLVRRLRPKSSKVYCRLIHRPGAEAQIDFAEIGRFRIDGRLRRAYLFCMSLCFSRMTCFSKSFWKAERPRLTASTAAEDRPPLRPRGPSPHHVSALPSPPPSGPLRGPEGGGGSGHAQVNEGGSERDNTFFHVSTAHSGVESRELPRVGP